MQAVKLQKGLEVFQLHTHLARCATEALALGLVHFPSAFIAFWPPCISWKREIMGCGNGITGKNPYFLSSFVEHFQNIYFKHFLHFPQNCEIHSTVLRYLNQVKTASPLVISKNFSY